MRSLSLERALLARESLADEKSLADLLCVREFNLILLMS